MNSKFYNHFSTLHPATLVTYFVAVVALAFTANTPVLLAVSLLSGLVLSCLLGVWKSSLFTLPLVLFIVILNPLLSHTGTTVLFYLNGDPITLEALLYGVRSGLTIVGAVLWFSVASVTVSEDKLLYAFSKPLPTVSLVVSMILKTVALFKKQYATQREALQTLGFSTKSGPLKLRIRTGAKLLVSVVTLGLEQSVDTAVSMTARGYGNRGKTRVSTYRFTLTDGVVIALTLLLTSATVTLTSFKLITLSSICYGVLLNTPLLHWVKEEIKWKLTH